MKALLNYLLSKGVPFESNFISCPLIICLYRQSFDLVICTIEPFFSQKAYLLRKVGIAENLKIFFDFAIVFFSKT